MSGIFITLLPFTDLLKHKAQPNAAADGVEAWVKGEREMRERLQREKDAREVREQALVSFLFFHAYILKSMILTPQLAARKT